jgi:hypothetical protein
MERSVLHWVCVVVLVTVPLFGCSDETAAAGGSGGSRFDGGSGGVGGSDLCGDVDCDDGNECTEDTCADGVCDNAPVADDTVCGDDAGTCQQGSCEVACTEQGIRDAIAAGGGPHTFDCDGPQTVVTEAPVVIDNDVILDGEGFLTVDGNDDHTVFFSSGTVTLEGIAVTRGRGVLGGGIFNDGTLTLSNCSVVGNFGDPPGSVDVDVAGIGNTGKLTVMNSTISGNTATGSAAVGGIFNLDGEVSIVNSTISGNTADSGAGGILTFQGEVSIVNSTISGNTADNGGSIVCHDTSCTIIGSLVDGDCSDDALTSNGHNIESPGNTCGFDQTGDQANVTEEELNLGELADNGGPTMTHALLPGSVAIDRIPEGDCAVDADQRHVSRPRGDGCDVGAVEVDLACVGADVGSECTHPNFTGVCGADTCWATDCSELSDGINCLVPRNRVTFPGRCAAGSCEEETVFP